MTNANHSLMQAYRDRVAAMNADIDAGIEANRKSDARVRVIDRQGNAVAGAHVTLRQKTHDFNFGCNGVQIGQKGAENDQYEQMFAKLFNLVTTTVCWAITETKEGHFRLAEADGDMFRRPPLERILAFGHKYGIKVKGQPLMADSWWPDWSSRDAETLKRQWVAFLKVMSEQFADRVDIWDVVNESMLCQGRNPNFPLWTPDLDYVDWCFEQAEKVFPKKHGVFELNEATFVNDGEKAEVYYRMAERIQGKGLPLEQIGFQFHMFTGDQGIRHLQNELLPMEKIAQTYRRFEALNLPLAITEITVPSRMPGFDDDEGEEAQAEMTRDLYRLWFSMPAMDTITYWNLMDGTHWRSEGECRGCLLDVNMREKPVYQALYQLIARRWKTNLDAETDAMGEVCFRGFHGRYEMTVDGEAGHRTLNLGVHRASPNTVIVTL